MTTYADLPNAAFATGAQAILWIAFGLQPKEISALKQSGFPHCLSSLSPQVLAKVYGRDEAFSSDEFDARINDAALTLYDHLCEGTIYWRASRATRDVHVLGRDTPGEHEIDLRFGAFLEAHKADASLRIGHADSERDAALWEMAFPLEMDWDAPCIPDHTYFDAAEKKVHSLCDFEFRAADLPVMSGKGALSDKIEAKHATKLWSLYQRASEKAQSFSQLDRNEKAKHFDAEFPRLLEDEAFVLDYLSPTMDVLLRLSSYLQRRVYLEKMDAKVGGIDEVNGILRFINGALAAAEHTPDHPFSMNFGDERVKLSVNALREFAACIRPIQGKHSPFASQAGKLEKANALPSYRYLVCRVPADLRCGPLSA